MSALCEHAHNVIKSLRLEILHRNNGLYECSLFIKVKVHVNVMYFFWSFICGFDWWVIAERVVVLVSECMSEWVNKGVSECMSEQINKGVSECKSEWLNQGVSEWMYGWANVWLCELVSESIRLWVHLTEVMSHWVSMRGAEMWVTVPIAAGYRI